LTLLGDGFGVPAAGPVGGMREKNGGRRGWRAAIQDGEEPPKRRAHELRVLAAHSVNRVPPFWRGRSMSASSAANGRPRKAD
jgi:hypothetical protein